MRSTLTFVISGVLLLAPACKKKNADTPSTTGSGSAVTTGSDTGSAMPDTGSAAGSGSATDTGSAAAAKVTDPQIAAIVVAANQVDIDAGNLALKKTKNDEVKKFAQQMVTDHTAINKAAVDLVTKLKVTPEESDASKGLVTSGVDTRKKLEALDGDAFDKAYVDNEVEYHKAVIGVIDTLLVPSASNEELKQTLVSVRPTIEAHLKHAESVQAAMKK